MKSIIHSTELKQLAREINDRESVISGIRDQVVNTLRLAGPEILLQGQALIKAKSQMPHGMWINWLKANCPAVSERNAQRYMARAANPTLTDYYSLLCDEAKTEASIERDPRQWPAYVEALGRATRFLGYIERVPLSRWPQEGRNKLKEQMYPLALQLWPERFQEPQ